MPYRVHEFRMSMTGDQQKLEKFLNMLEGEVVAVLPNVMALPMTHVDRVLIIERYEEARPRREPSRIEELAVP